MSGSRAYIVLAASTLIYFLALFPQGIFSIIYVACIERYAVSRSEAVYPTTIYACMRSLSGIITTYLSSKIGEKATTILGGALSSLGLGACFFAEDILFVTISFGIVSGIGLCMNISLIHYFLKPYFNKNFGIACGITQNGAVISRIVFAPVAEFLLKQYGLPGAFLLFGAIMLNTIPFLMLIKVKNTQTNPCEGSKKTLRKQPIPTDKSTVTRKSIKYYENSISLESIPANNSALTFSSPHDLHNIKHSNSNESSKNSENTLLQRDESSLNHSLNLYHTKHSVANDSSKNSEQNHGPMSAVCMKEESADQDATDVSQINNNTLVDSSRMQILGGFVEPCFFVIILAASCFMYIFVVGLSIIIDVSREKNLPRENEVYLLTVGPIPDVISNILVGKLIDKGIVSNVTIAAIFFVAYSVVCACLVWADSFFTYISGVLLFGIINNGFFVIFPVLICEFIDQKNQVLAHSSKFLLYGLLCFTASPLIGHFRDKLGTYTGVLYVLSLIALTCSIFMTILPFLSKRNK